MNEPTAFQLFGVVATNGDAAGPMTAGSELVVFRDLAAVVLPREYESPGEDEIPHYRRVVEGIFRQQEILPAPPGVVFRSRDILVQWLELHYFSLLDALVFVEKRSMARITIHRPTEDLEESALPGDSESGVLQDSLRILRRQAAATVGLGSDDESLQSEISFLVPQDRWSLFADLVRRENERLLDHRLELSGPWPPYDFIRMKFSN